MPNLVLMACHCFRLPSHPMGLEMKENLEDETKEFGMRIMRKALWREASMKKPFKMEHSGNSRAIDWSMRFVLRRAVFFRGKRSLGAIKRVERIPVSCFWELVAQSRNPSVECIFEIRYFSVPLGVK